eukprot:TRINITY_DN12630_c0_g1_i1.p1 TRINITY_DN12630_c0_g1~~TRINITY_DN12630_c0_g1_i1.p1  ORF type:complete len:464 (-),score=29.48 TRINITY_DN12630_c0_g1_i1:118-1467(-)
MPAIAASGLTQREKTDLIRTIKLLGGSFSDSVSPTTTHLIVDEPSRRTIKVLIAICRGLPIVGKQWITDSKAEHTWLDHMSYCSPMWRESLERRSENAKIFRGLKMSLQNYKYWDAQISHSDTSKLVELCSGLIDSNYEKEILICSNLAQEQSPTNRVCVPVEWLLSSISQWRLQPVGKSHSGAVETTVSNLPDRVTNKMSRSIPAVLKSTSPVQSSDSSSQRRGFCERVAKIDTLFKAAPKSLEKSKGRDTENRYALRARQHVNYAEPNTQDLGLSEGEENGDDAAGRPNLPGDSSEDSEPVVRRKVKRPGRTPVSSESGADSENEYEQEREEQIRRNREMLLQLGLSGSLCSVLGPKQKKLDCKQTKPGVKRGRPSSGDSNSESDGSEPGKLKRKRLVPIKRRQSTDSQDEALLLLDTKGKSGGTHALHISSAASTGWVESRRRIIY